MEHLLDFFNMTFQDFQKEIVKAAEVFATIGYRKIEAGVGFYTYF